MADPTVGRRRDDVVLGAVGFESRGRRPECLVLRHEALGIGLHFWKACGVDRWTNDVARDGRFSTPDEVRRRHADWAEVQVREPAVLSQPEEEWGAVEFHVTDVRGDLVRRGGSPESTS